MPSRKNASYAFLTFSPGKGLGYLHTLEEQICLLLAFQPRSFCDIVLRAGGAFPTEVAIALSNVVKKGHVRQRGERYTLVAGMANKYHRLPNFADFVPWRAHSHARGRHFNSRITLPDPHPADYDWRFTQAALHSLVQLLHPLTAQRSRIVLLGAPSLFLRLAEIGADVTLLDRNSSLVADLHKSGFRKAFTQDMFSKLPGNIRGFGVAIADPPWYLEFYEAFITRASQLLCDHGLFLLSMLPWLTRPSAIRDRTEILRMANKAGFHLIEVLPEFLQYETPYFERVALRHYGIDCGTWRKADLFVLVKVRRGKKFGTHIPKPEHEEWDDFRFGNRKIKLKRKKNGPLKDFFYRPVAEESPVLRTVSRRWPHRRLIDVWTSDNEAYVVHGLGILRRALQLLQRPTTVARTVALVTSQFSMNSKASNTLRELLIKLLKRKTQAQSSIYLSR